MIALSTEKQRRGKAREACGIPASAKREVAKASGELEAMAGSGAFDAIDNAAACRE